MTALPTLTIKVTRTKLMVISFQYLHNHLVDYQKCFKRVIETVGLGENVHGKMWKSCSRKIAHNRLQNEPIYCLQMWTILKVLRLHQSPG